jgi:hypothetical protein
VIVVAPLRGERNPDAGAVDPHKVAPIAADVGLKQSGSELAAAMSETPVSLFIRYHPILNCIEHGALGKKTSHSAGGRVPSPRETLSTIHLIVLTPD